MPTTALKGHLQQHWPALRERLLAGDYHPQPVRRVSIPKPQGGPLSPLLSNVLLTELDRELERRGHRFCRYADDCNIYVRSERAGHQVMAGVTRFLKKHLRLKVNTAKSAVDHPKEPEGLHSQAAPATEAVTEPVADNHDPEPEPGATRVGELLLPDGLEAFGHGTGWLDTAAASPDSVAAMEANPDTGTHPDAAWSE